MDAEELRHSAERGTMRIAVHAAWLLAALLVIGSQRLLEMRVGAQGRRIPVYAVDPIDPPTRRAEFPNLARGVQQDALCYGLSLEENSQPPAAGVTLSRG